MVGIFRTIEIHPSSCLRSKTKKEFYPFHPHSLKKIQTPIKPASTVEIYGPHDHHPTSIDGSRQATTNMSMISSFISTPHGVLILSSSVLVMGLLTFLACTKSSVPTWLKKERRHVGGVQGRNTGGTERRGGRGRAEGVRSNGAALSSTDSERE